MSDDLHSSVQGSLQPVTERATIRGALQALGKRDKQLAHFLANPCLPVMGWEDEFIEFVLSRLASMDANHNSSSSMGEREGRIYSALVRRRHWGFAHGIGRSGDLSEVQPKAPGSSLLQMITNKLVRQALKVAGIGTKEWECTVVPMATGMTLALVLRTLAAQRPGSRYVLMGRIDQKSCIKCVGAAGLELVTIGNRLEADSMRMDIDALAAKIKELGCSQVASIVTISSCFAPRGCDDLLAAGRLCREFGIPHLVNNAYGIQSPVCVSAINRARQEKVLDVMVASSDKNFMVPVGGAIVAANTELLAQITASYAGRASISPLLDLFTTLVSMGSARYKALLTSRTEMFMYLYSQLQEVEKLGLIRVLVTAHNDISLAFLLTAHGHNHESGPDLALGSKLFLRGISGARLVRRSPPRSIQGHQVENFGMHHDAYPPDHYVAVAAAIGQEKKEIDIFIRRLTRLLVK